MSSCYRIQIENARQWHKVLSETLQEIDKANELDEPVEPEEVEEETEEEVDWVTVSLIGVGIATILFVGYMWASLLCGNL